MNLSNQTIHTYSGKAIPYDVELEVICWTFKAVICVSPACFTLVGLCLLMHCIKLRYSVSFNTETGEKLTNFHVSFKVRIYHTFPCVFLLLCQIDFTYARNYIYIHSIIIHCVCHVKKTR